MNDVKYIET